MALFMRPALMFHPDGRWKEFGLADSGATLFPFWLFCIVWAVTSFLLGRLLLDNSGEPSAALLAAQGVGLARNVSVTATALGTPYSGTLLAPEELLDHKEEAAVLPLEVPGRKKGKRKAAAAVAPRPGYYRLDEDMPYRRNGSPRFVYVGPELPLKGGGEDTEDSDSGSSSAGES